MSDNTIRIQKLENGYQVQVCDPKIEEKNRKSKSGWEDPYKSYAFSTAKEVLAFVAGRLGEHGKTAKEIFDEEYAEATKEK